MAEQYFLRPVQSAHLSYLSTGKLGRVVQARVSFCNDYHAVSLIRKYLGLTFEPVRIHASSFPVPGYPGYGRGGNPEQWTLKEQEQMIAALDFGNCVGVYDFENMQHRSWIRSQQVQIKGERGEINNDRIRRLISFDTPVEASFIRQDMGEDVNIEGYGLKGIQAEGEWVFTNPYLNSRLTDDEIAVARAMELMGCYVRGGEVFYPLAQALHDVYLSRLIRQAADSGDFAVSTPQPWEE